MNIGLCEHSDLEIVNPADTLFEVRFGDVLVGGRGDFPAYFECARCGASLDMEDIERRLRPPKRTRAEVAQEKRQYEELELIRRSTP